MLIHKRTGNPCQLRMLQIIACEQSITNGCLTKKGGEKSRRQNILGEGRHLRLGPVLFLSAGGGGKVKLLHGCPGGRVYPKKYAGGGGGKLISEIIP